MQEKTRASIKNILFFQIILIFFQVNLSFKNILKKKIERKQTHYSLMKIQYICNDARLMYCYIIPSNKKRKRPATSYCILSLRREACYESQRGHNLRTSDTITVACAAVAINAPCNTTTTTTSIVACVDWRFFF